MVDARLGLHDQEEITAGEAVAGMILNGLGFSDRPLTLTPQFFVNKPLDLLFREGVRAEMFNRFKLGRTLDEAHAYGCDLLLSELSLSRLFPRTYRYTLQPPRHHQFLPHRGLCARQR